MYRETLCEILNEMSTGRNIENQECLKALAEVIKASLDCKILSLTTIS